MEDVVLLPEENADIVGFIQNYVDGPGAQDPWLAQWTLQEMEQCDRFVMSYMKCFQCENTFTDGQLGRVCHSCALPATANILCHFLMAKTL